MLLFLKFLHFENLLILISTIPSNLQNRIWALSFSGLSSSESLKFSLDKSFKFLSLRIFSFIKELVLIK